MKEKLAFIDHSFHRKTQATRFLIELLKNEYDVEVFWDESWRGHKSINFVSLAENGYNKIILFQTYHIFKKDLLAIGNKDVVVCPMYDSSPLRNSHYFKKFLPIKRLKFLNFSQSLHSQIDALGLKSKYFQYYLPPNHNGVYHKKQLKGFFWQRTNQITWKHIRKLIRVDDFDSLHIHTAVDPPGYKLIKPREKEAKYLNIVYSKWFPRQQDYLDTVNKCDVFFAPRFSEGIGISVLEALAMGKCVIAPNRPTMNEYIKHGITGFLYNPNNPLPIDLSNIDKIQSNTRELSEIGFHNWKRSKHQLLEYICCSKPNRPNIQIQQNSYSGSGNLYPVFLKIKYWLKRKFPFLQNLLLYIRKWYR